MATQTISPTRCRKCGAEESPDVVLWASVDLNATVCGSCHNAFDEWADANPGRVYADFLEGRPARKPRHRARPTLLTRHRERTAQTEEHMWAAQGVERPTYRGRHAAEVA